ncbi:MAG: hypothetical protein KBC33_02490 [Candidatus Pacebacteria bacterium]|nr:hypothetical protein [Candidatus Paceibacterota bacterium]
MKKKTLRYSVGLMLGLMVTFTAAHSWAALSTNVGWFHLNFSLPDVTKVDFATGRDYFMVQAQTARITSTQSRVGRPTGLEIRRSFETGDIVVSTNGPIWRGVFNPPGYMSQSGNRLYGAWVAYAKDQGKLRLDHFETEAICFGVPALNNSSSLSNQTYSVSRRGVQVGSDGLLWTADDVYVMSGPGSIEVDAVVFIGSRIGALVRDQNDIEYLNEEIGTNGTYIKFTSKFKSPIGVLSSSEIVALYPQGMIPARLNGFELFTTPQGGLWSITQTQGFGPVSLKSSHVANGFWTHANPANSAATEGSSEFVMYLGGDGNNGFAKVEFPSVEATSQLATVSAVVSFNKAAAIARKTAPKLSPSALFIPAPSDDLDQDR